ncbi:polyhydroxyalkanoic acid system family protein [Croceibacterium aestuarii]|uniref:polyhydroxyalkanoic acid system family protein n=1 Tax=Croceibacterium aestuarii TaxID=3064139 RepID=UPI00272E1744|nr:polyhydroxyalkanoic acid system family protein [Croceibacterium sp. D39]
MQVAIPHHLDRSTVRQRLRDNSHKIADHVPGGVAEVHTNWRNEDTMEMTIGALGQQVRGEVQIEDGQVVFVIDLPPALGFMEPMVRGAIEQSGQKMIAGPNG